MVEELDVSEGQLHQFPNVCQISHYCLVEGKRQLLLKPSRETQQHRTLHAGLDASE